MLVLTSSLGGINKFLEHFSYIALGGEKSRFYG